MRRCPDCGAEVPDNSLTCPKCYSEVGRELESKRGAGPEGHASPRSEQGKSGNIALLLTVLPGLVGVWGLGHLYLGERDRGIEFLLGGIALTALMIILGSTSFLVFTVVCLVFLALIWLAAFGYHILEVIALIAVKGASPPRSPF